MDLLKAVEDVLESAHQPLHVGVITEKVISGGLGAHEQGLIITTGDFSP